MDLNEQYKNIENLSKQLDELSKLQNKAYASLDKNSYEKVKQHQIDANEMMREFRKGNYNALDNLVKKYTTTDAGNNR